MHIGKTTGLGSNRPWLRLSKGKNEGVVSEDGLVFGTYIHGLFAADKFRGSFLNRFRSGKMNLNFYDSKIEKALDQVALKLESYIDIDSLISM